MLPSPPRGPEDYYQYARSLEIHTLAGGAALACFRCDRQRAMGVIKAGRLEHEALECAVEVHEQLLAHGAFVVERFEMLAGAVEPGDRTRQVDERQTAIAHHLHVGGAAVVERLVA